MCLLFFFFNDTATTEIYTLSLHDALPIWRHSSRVCSRRCESQRLQKLHLRSQRLTESPAGERLREYRPVPLQVGDRKSTRLNSSHANISYAVFCLKKKKKKQ